MPVYPIKDKPGKWRIVVWQKNKRHETTHTGKKSEAEQAEARWRIELEANGSAPTESRIAPRFSEFCPRYGEHAREHLRPKTWEIRRYQLATLAEFFGEMRLTEIGTEQIDRYKAHRKRAGIQPRTINTELAKLQAVLRYAREIGVPCASPKVRRLPEIGRGRVTFWTEEQQAALLVAVEHEAKELLPIVVFLANTGCRKGEALACEQAWIDLRRDYIRIAPNADWQPKDNEPREIPISDELRPWLEKALAEPHRYVFRSRDGGRWAFWPRKAFDRARALAGRCAACLAADPHPSDPKKAKRCPQCMPALRGGPHTLRHSFAAAFLAGGGEMYLLSKILGHASIRITERTYAHLLPQHLERARNVVSVGAAVGPATMEARKRWAR